MVTYHFCLKKEEIEHQSNKLPCGNLPAREIYLRTRTDGSSLCGRHGHKILPCVVVPSWIFKVISFCTFSQESESAAEESGSETSSVVEREKTPVGKCCHGD